MADAPSTTASEFAPSEMAVSEMGEASPAREPTTFPPYPPYATEPAPPSVADTIIAGRDLRLQYKSLPKQLVRPPPKPARPKGPKATDVKVSRRAARAHARCLRKHGAVLTDRLEHMSKPPRRAIINMWREHADTLPPETISRLRTMLDADEPFKPDQAYEYFINLKKSKKKNAALRVNQIKKDVLAMCGDKRFLWARNATVAFARGIQLRLSRPGRFTLADGMLRLSNIILNEICGYMGMRIPSRRCTHPKAKFMMDVADKIAVWIDEILSESDDRMLMMDFDEDEDLFKEFGDTGFADDFLNMMGDGGLFKGPQPAYLKFTGEMLEAFMILTESMEKKASQQLLSHGKFNQTYEEGANELKQAQDFDASEFDTTLAEKLNKDLTAAAKPNTPNNIAPFMKDMVEICSNYLAQNAEYNKDKGPAFKLLIQTMRSRSSVVLFEKEKLRKTYSKAATELEEAKGLDNDHDEPNLSQEIHANLSQLVESVTPNELKTDMAETVDISSKYLSQRAIDELERGPAFDVLIEELEKFGADPFTPQFTPLGAKYAAAYALKSAPGLSSVTPDETTAPIFVAALHRAADAGTPKALRKDMHDVVERCGNYLSAFVRDRDKAMQILLKAMKSNPTKEFTKRRGYSLDYGTAAAETEAAPVVVPFLPIKDIACEGRDNLNKDVETVTPVELQTAMKSAVQDVSRYLSQPVALRSGAAGMRYPLNFLTAITKSLGTRPLFKFKSYGQTYSDAADVLKYAGPLESDPKCEQLQYEIINEMKRGVPTKLAPTIASGLDEVSVEAAKHLAKIGTEKGQALDYLVGVMKQKGLSTLGQMQGYQQTYNDGARRIENAPTLANEKIDKGVYETVRGKLTKLITEKPSPEYDKLLPELVDESSKFLSAPMPETDAEKRHVLADLMGRKGVQIVGEDGLYKLTFTEAGDEILKAPVGVVTASDAAKNKEMHGKISSAIPDKKMQEILKDPANEGAAYLTDVIHDRGEALQIIHDEMKDKKGKDFLTIGKFKKTHGEAAAMISEASKFGGQHPSPVIVDKVKERIDELPKAGGSEGANRQMDDTASIVSAYIAGVATEECGLDAKALAALDRKGKSASALNVAEDEAERLRREAEEAERKKREEEERKKREEEEKKKGSEEEERKRREQEEMRRLEEERKKKEEEEARRKREEEEAKRRKDAEGSQHKTSKPGRPSAADLDRERDQALSILHNQLRARDKEILYKQPHTELTHSQASQWIGMKPPMRVDKSVKESADTSRLHKKFERKLSLLVAKSTPNNMYDTMQDVIIESSRILSEYFVSSNYKALVREALISEMQRRGNEILIEVDGAAETFFFSAQRLKKAKSMEVKEPCSQVAYYLNKRLDDMIRCRSMARKLTATMKDHVKDASDYLSELVTKPDEQIEAYVSLLGEMEAAGDALLIEGNIPKSYKDAAAYLRQLTSLEDQIGRGNSSLQSSTEGKLKNLMTNVTASGYSVPVMNGVIKDSTRLLVSYIMLQGEKTEALKIMVEKMEQTGECVLLRHGNLRKSYVEGANRLRGKNTDQLSVPSADPVVARKIQIKLNNLMRDCTPPNYQALIDDVIEDATMYLAVHFLQPHIIKVCKCMKNVFVQCELWCDEILRRVTRPCCTCSRHISAQALEDLAPGQRLRISPGSSRAFAPGLEISLTQCPARPSRSPRRGEKPTRQPCPAPKPTEGCRQTTASYLLYSTEYSLRGRFEPSPTRMLRTSSDSLQTPATPSSPSPSRLTSYSSTSPLRSHFFGMRDGNDQMPRDNASPFLTPHKQMIPGTSSSSSFHTPANSNNASLADTVNTPFWQNPTAMYAKYSRDTNRQTPDNESTSRRRSRLRSGYHARTPIISTDQMSDWHAMMVSLMWNVQAWRDWIQENIDRALAFQHPRAEANGTFVLDPTTFYKSGGLLTSDIDENWGTFQRRVATEALQWRQYNTFSRQLTLRLVLRYQDKQIVSPTRATVKTQAYMDCQREMLDIIDMFNRWTQWLTLVIKETDSLREDSESDISLQEMRWRYFKSKVEEYADDWDKYNMHLKVCWERKYRSLIADWLPAWKQSGPVWVVSACGAVPSGAVAAGVFDGEVVWVARTTHKCNVLPAALHPSKHCCLVYADGAVHHYTKYQVMCNAEVRWVAWRSGAVGARAVRVARGVHAGRVLYRGSHLLGAVLAPHYRCHVLIFDRPFAFNCYELLVLADN